MALLTTLFFLTQCLVLPTLAAPPVLTWPSSFYFECTNQQIAAPNLDVPCYFAVDENYQGGSEAVYRKDGYYNGICGTISGNIHTDCVQITTNGVRYVLNPELDTCCRCCTDGCGTLGSFWINSNPELVGPYNVRGTESYHWHITGGDVNSLFLAVNDSRITEITDGDTDNFTSIMSTYTTSVNRSLFDIPKGCDDVICNQAVPVCAGEDRVPELLKEDLERASTWIPSEPYKATDLLHASSVFNAHLDSNKHLKTASCGDWTLEEMDIVQRWLASHAHYRLLKIYEDARDPRAMTDGAGGSKEDLEATWVKMQKVGETSALARQLLTTGRCRQSVMWYTHHLSAEAKGQFIEAGMILPRLPTEEEEAHLDEDAVAEMTKEEKWAYEVGKTMAACTLCHIA